MVIDNDFPELNCKLEKKLVKRLDRFALMATRQKQIQDVLFTVHGRTGSGKTNTSLVCAFWLKKKTGRDIHLFFSTGKATDFAKATKEKIIIIDEPSLDSLSKDQMSRVSKNFIRLLNTMRQKRQIVIVNITRFWRFPFDLVVDRSLAMINMKDNDGSSSMGRFQFIRQRHLERLWEDFQRFRKKTFGSCKSFCGYVPERMESLDENGQPWFNRMGVIINGKENCTLQDYKDARDKEVAGIGEDKPKTKKELWAERRLNELRYKVAMFIQKLDIPKEILAAKFGVKSNRFREWALLNENNENLLGDSGLEDDLSTS